MTEETTARPDFFERRYPRLLLALLVFSALLRVALHLDMRWSDPTLLAPQLDSDIYLRWAHDIVNGDVFGGRTFFLNPLYPYLLAPLVALFGDPGVIHAMLLVQGLMGLGTVWLVVSATRRFAPAGVALLAGLLAGVWPTLLYYEEKLMIVTLATFLNALALRLLVRFEERRTLASAALVGAAVGVGIVARPNVGLFLVVLLPWIAALGPAGGRARFMLARGGAMFLAAVLVVLPVTVRNALVGGEFAPTTTGFGTNFWQGNNPDAWQTGMMASVELRAHPYYMEKDSVAVAERDLGRDLKPSEVSAYWAKKTVKTMLSRPGPALLHLLRKGYWFFRDFEIPSSYHFEAERKLTTLLPLVPLDFGMLSPLAALGVLLVLRVRRAWPAALLFLTYLAATMLIYPYSHHRAPALPAAFPLAAIALASLAAGLRERRRRALVTVAVLLAALVGTHATTLAGALGIRSLSADPFFRTHDEIYRLNRGVTLLGLGEPELAERALRDALSRHPESELVCTGLADVAKFRGDVPMERRWLLEALARAPDDAVGLSRIAQLEFAVGNPAEARRWALRAVDSPQADPGVFLTLARVELVGGNFRQALLRFEEAEARGVTAPELMADQSLCLRALGRAPEALARVRRGLARAPESALLLVETVEALLAQDPPDLAGARRLAPRAAARSREQGYPLPESVRRLCD